MADEYPQVVFGDEPVAKIDWRKADLPEEPDDDEQTASEDVIAMLGFDPKEIEEIKNDPVVDRQSIKVRVR